MPRAAGYILNGFALFSLVLCLASGVLWVRQIRHTDHLCYHSPGTFRMLMASPDGLEYVDLGDQGDFFGLLMGSSLDALSEHWHYYREVDHGEGTGFIFQRSDTGRGDRVGVPYWFACIVGLVAPVLWTVRRRRRMVKFRSHCPICGYDLRATPDRCPECGTVTDTASQTD